MHFLDCISFLCADILPEPNISHDAALSADRQASPLSDRPGSSQSRKRPGSSLQRELTALTGDEGVHGVTDPDVRKKRRTAAIASELKQQQGQRLL